MSSIRQALENFLQAYGSMEEGGCKALDDAAAAAREALLAREDDCYVRALSDEPRFTLLARDPAFYRLLVAWAEEREQAVLCGDRPASDLQRVRDARYMARDGQVWRKENNGKWRRQTV